MSRNHRAARRSLVARARPAVISVHQLVISGRESRESNGDDRGRARHTGVARRTGRVFGAMSTSRRRYASKWLTLVLCQLVMLSSGTLYLFPVYSPALKRELDLTQEQVNFVGSAAHFGAFFSVFGGIFFDRFGSRATLTLGAALKFAGLTALAGTVSGWLPRSHGFAALCGYVYGTGCSTSLTAALGANYATFKDKNVHGRLVGLSSPSSASAAASSPSSTTSSSTNPSPLSDASPSSPEAPTSPRRSSSDIQNTSPSPATPSPTSPPRAFTNQAPSPVPVSAPAADSATRPLGSSAPRMPRRNSREASRRAPPSPSTSRSPPLSPNSRTAHLSWLSRASP